MRNIKSRIYKLPMHLHKHHLYLLEQHSFMFSYIIIHSYGYLITSYQNIIIPSLAQVQRSYHLPQSFQCTNICYMLVKNILDGEFYL